MFVGEFLNYLFFNDLVKNNLLLLIMFWSFDVIVGINEGEIGFEFFDLFGY